MLKRLRLRMTGLYILAALALIGLMVAGAYVLLDRYFRETTDLALSYRVAQEMRVRGMELPAELLRAEQHWESHAGTPQMRPPNEQDHEGDEEDSSEHGTSPTTRSELAPIMLLTLDASGRTQASSDAPMPPDRAAVVAAASSGSDWRTIRLSDGTPVRIFTQRLMVEDAPVFVQAGRAIDDQERTLYQLLLGLLALGGMTALIVGAVSWTLAGRSLEPVQQAWERQQAFVANAGHELRTPLTLMRASTEVAQRSLPPDATDSRELLGDVLTECDYMSHLVEDLLLLSRLDNRGLPLDVQRVPLAELLADVSRQVGRIAEERGIALNTTLGAAAVRADPLRLRQIILILLDNALRYTPPGGRVMLSTAATPHHVELAVADTGAGIAAEHLPRLFERFYRVDSSRTGATGGSGLGLAIAHGLIEAQGGRIAIASAVGVGTTVTITLPTA